MQHHHNHILIDSPVHLVIGPPPNDPETFWPSSLLPQLDEDVDEDGDSSHCGNTSEDSSTGGEDDPESPTTDTGNTGGNESYQQPTRPALHDTESPRHRPRRHHHRHRYHSLSHPWIWGIIERRSMRQDNDEALPSSSSMRNAANDWIRRISHFTFVAKPKALGVWPPSRPKPHGCLPPSLYYSLLLTAYGTHETAQDRNDGSGQVGTERDGYVVLKRWIVPFVHRLGDGHDDAGGLTTRLTSSEFNSSTGNGSEKVDLGHQFYYGQDETESIDDQVNDEDDGGAFIAQKWGALKAVATGDKLEAATPTMTATARDQKEANNDIPLYLIINTLLAEDSAATQIQTNFLEPVTQTKQASLPGFQEYWIETLHEHGLRAGLQAVQGQSAVQQQEQQSESFDFSRSPFCYCSADIQVLLPCE
ncbi:hypothetical protein DFQ27_006563 [Actinomortierella ambigua]|uniref:Uncharacterized protein n=1 Tax=Actinomortierella ambigua TaxID=1343610 RepID=A0A9P6UBZ9_9FUNG|nr:hypothetical protein DFQ27_006563 [Actinomortierella ambigua]